MPRHRQIYAQSFGKNPEFYKFYRSLEAYRATFKAHGDVMVLDSNSEFFKYFKGPATPRSAARPLPKSKLYSHCPRYPSRQHLLPNSRNAFSRKIVDSAPIRVQAACAHCCPIFNNSRRFAHAEPGFCLRISPTSCRPKRARSKSCAA
jgi:hypothetical protein